MNKKNELTANQALKLAVEAADSGDKKKAEKYFNAVLKSYPDNQDAINGIKALNPNNLYRSELDELKGLLKQGKFKEVVIRGNMLLERYTDVFELYHYVAVAMGSDGKHAEALPYFKRAAELNPHDVNAQFNLGNAFRTFGDHKKAIESYKRVLKIDHAFAPAYNNAGNTFMDMKDYFNAIEAFDSASRLYPKSFEMQNNMALALKASGDYKQAIIYFKKVAELNGDIFEAHHEIALCYELDGNIDKAKETYEFLLNAEADFPDGHISYANLLHKTGEYDAAINHYENAVAMAPGAPIVYNNLANVYRDIGELDKAENGFQKSFSLAPHALELILNLADVKKLKGDYVASRALYENVDEKSPNRPVPIINLAILNFLLGDVEAAKKYADILTDKYIANVEGDEKRETCNEFKFCIDEFLNSKTVTAKKPNASIESIYVVGDIAALGFHGKIITIDGQDFRVDVKWVMGLNASDLSREDNNHIKASVNNHLSNMVEGSLVHFKFESDDNTNAILKSLCDEEKVTLVSTL